jgi:hypothetical protein
MSPAEPLLNHRQSRYAQRLLSRPAGSQSAREILSTKGSAIGDRLRTMSHLKEGDRAEESFVVDGMVFPGLIMSDVVEEEAVARATDWTDKECTAWTDGSRLDDGKVGCSVVWAVEEEAGTSRCNRWEGQAYHLGSNKEVFDAELYAIYQAIMRFGKRRDHNQTYTIFADAQAALLRCASDDDSPGQALARTIIG